MMRAQIYHWFQGTKEYKDIDDLEQFILEHNGAVQVYPPVVNSLDESVWLIVVTDKTNRFNQR